MALLNALYPLFRSRLFIRRAIISLVFFLIIILVILPPKKLNPPGTRLKDSIAPASEKLAKEIPARKEPPPCPDNLSHLQRPEYGLTREIIYQKRCIRPIVSDAVDRNNVSEIAQPLLQRGDLIQLDHGCRGRRQQRCEPILLQVPPPYPKRDYSDIMFGVATSYDRLNTSMSQFQGWLSNSNATLLAIVTDTDKHENDFNKMTMQYRRHGIDLLMIRPWNMVVGANEQHFIIIRDLVWLSSPETKWIAIIDDDTYFPTLYPLATALDKHDASLPKYLGALSENFDQVKNHGFMAFGGAGAFLSMSLARKLETYVDQCLKEDTLDQGDGLLKNCIYRRTKTKLSILPGLHQLDMHGDMGGFYESGISPTSLHHWKSWHKVPVDKMGMIAQMCGDCFLQRFKFGSDTVLTNGYSIASYANGTAHIDFSKTEAT